jgi:broad specificity phosphatase PhoE
MSSETRIILLRHAEVEARYQKVFGGWADMNLSPLGHTQSVALASYLAGKSFDALYASPMLRVQQTIAPLLAKKPGLQPVLLEGLKEVNFGDWTGHGWAEVKAKFGVSPFDWLEKLEKAEVPNGESGAVFRERVEPCLKQIIKNHNGGTVAIACHGGTIRMILSIIFAMPLSRTEMFDIDYASVSQVDLLPHRSEIALLNYTPWREAGK